MKNIRQEKIINPKNFFTFLIPEIDIRKMIFWEGRFLTNHLDRFKRQENLITIKNVLQGAMGAPRVNS